MQHPSRSKSTPPARKLLQEMTPVELRDWLATQQAELEDFCTFAQQYQQRRARRGQHTLTDDRYAQFLTQASDLLAGLEELRQAVVQAVQDDQKS